MISKGNKILGKNDTRQIPVGTEYKCKTMAPRVRPDDGEDKCCGEGCQQPYLCIHIYMDWTKSGELRHHPTTWRA